MNDFIKYKHNITSQWGEDGIITEIFKRISPKEKFCIEFGAWDGKHLSNIWNLWHEQGWSALLIEAEGAKIPLLEKSLEEFPNVKAFHARVQAEGETSLDSILKKTFPNKEIDILSIDIDSDDYYIFESLSVQPRVVLVEYNPTVPPEMEVIQEKGAYFGSSALALCNLARRKGYTLASLTETNLFFVRNDEFLKLEVQEPSLKDIFIKDNLTYIMTGYDGTPAVSRIPTYHDLERDTTKTIRFNGVQYTTVTLKKYKEFFIEKILIKIKQKIKHVLFQETSKSKAYKKQEQRVQEWNRINGDKTLRLSYPLDENSVVVDVGGFKGQWASEIFDKYCCQVIIFEPIQKFSNEIKNRFLHNKNITCHTLGLSDKNSEVAISLIGDQTSLFKEDSNLEKIQIVNASEFFTAHNVQSIDLIKINIEGEEYNLLENLIESGFIKNIDNIQVQFHDFVPYARERMESLKEKLFKTHTPTYQYEFVWENWKRKTN